MTFADADSDRNPACPLISALAAWLGDRRPTPGPIPPPEPASDPEPAPREDSDDEDFGGWDTMIIALLG